MFQNDFFSIINQDLTSETISTVIKIDARHKIFEGHFPGSPVTPGVVQLQIVKDILENHLHKSLTMKTMRTCKFLQILNPLSTPSLTIDIKFVQKDFLEVVASGAHNGTVYFKAQISYS
jgi:3-hydroxyacyl-[acyl-carrier-protein] dehydratase